MSFSEILGDMENDNAIERDSKHLATIAALRAENEAIARKLDVALAENERLRAQLDEENWLGCLIDRLNEFARENASLFTECRNGREASALIQLMHGQFNGYRIRYTDTKTARDTYREIAGELHRDALEVYTRVPYEHETAGLKSAMDKLSTTLARWTEIEGWKG